MWVQQNQGNFSRERRSQPLWFSYIGKRGLMKKTAGREGEGKDEKWQIVDAVVCMRTMGVIIAGCTACVSTMAKRQD